MEGNRTAKLHGYFMQVLAGKDELHTSPKARRFLEAVRSELDPVACAEKMISSSNGISALQQAVRVDTTAAFISTSVAEVLQYFQSPALAVACNGDLLRQIMQPLVDPLFWKAFVSHIQAQSLDAAAVQCFAWMLLGLLSHSGPGHEIYISTATDPKTKAVLQDAERPETRNLYHKILRLTDALTTDTIVAIDGPGGRHNNDFADFRQIAIMPSIDELITTENPFLRFALEIEEGGDDQRLLTLIDNQYRLLREDMLRELKAEVAGQEQRKKKRIDDLRLLGASCDGDDRWAVELICMKGFHFMSSHMSPKKRQDFLKAHPKVLANGSLACLFVDGKVVGFGTISRKEDKLANNPPIITLHLPNDKVTLRRTLKDLRNSRHIQLLQLHTAIFAYQPILLQLQKVYDLPLAKNLVNWRCPQDIVKTEISSKLLTLVRTLEVNSSVDLKSALSLPKSVKLDHSQAASFIAALTQQTAVIQGPPGTGKSFIGAIVAKALYCCTELKILVLSYTNHALDQYLEDLINIGIPKTDIVRLGSSFKTSPAVQDLVLSRQVMAKKSCKLNRGDWSLIDTYRIAALDARKKFEKAFQAYNRNHVSKQNLMDWLEFTTLPEYQDFFDAFQLPQGNSFKFVGAQGKVADKFYLLNRWQKNKGASNAIKHTLDYPHVWSMSREQRSASRSVWCNAITEDLLSQVIDYGQQYDNQIALIQSVRNEGGRRLMKDMRVIGCTTTAAAKYVRDIQSAQPDVIIVEEAGEILESHVLAALGAETKQLILIGDHKQLRPKCHYDLSVEKGTGYDLNRSLFEKLVLKDYPHQKLTQQHRMRPEISALVRSMTYPELTDADDTKNRGHMRGFQSNVVFVNHSVPENVGKEVYDPRDGGMSASKTNDFEASIIPRCVKYLAQQGYRSDQIVVLTPYLGQLRLIHDKVRTENDPVLNDLDSHDLVRAGLMPQSTADAGRAQLRISTIDNYQGEESDIVVVSLTRSNDRGDIGFMASPERLNVLISRARDGLILIGNVDTFSRARKGQETWSGFLRTLREGKYIYDGLPVRCERHNKKEAVLKLVEDFDIVCPDGGCDMPCGTLLSCGLHTCSSKCHQLYDHSKMRCEEIMTDTCSSGHKMSWECHKQRPPLCRICRKEKEREEERQRRDHQRSLDRLAAEQAHEAKMAEADAQIEEQKQLLRDANLEEDRKRAHEQKMADLQQARDSVKHAFRARQPPSSNKNTSGTPPANGTVDATQGPATTSTRSQPTDRPEPSSASQTWECLKEREGVSSRALDKLMEMTGLETVKARFVEQMNKILTAQRQNVDSKQERLGTVFLGNPGTGKTTVARLYASFLAEVNAVSGSEFHETTGAKLASEGVQGAKKTIDNMLKAGGGAILVDEAYQLVSGNSHGGGAVLDFLLAEIENTTGKIVFLFAGYKSQMEKFFQHNEGLASRMPHRLEFADYSESELQLMLEAMLNKRYQRRMQVEDGLSGLYMRIVVRRLHRTSGREGFGNARALENVLDRISAAQATRLERERRAGLKPNDFMIVRNDLIGPEPSEVLKHCTAWNKLNKLVGLDDVKACIRTLLDTLISNYARELKEKPPIEVSLNRMFLGPPGTGKTTVAKLYGEILADIGLLSTSECVVKIPQDLKGSVLGESERNTKAVLQNSRGKVLVIDEAYMLYSSSSVEDPYNTAVIDTIVSEVSNKPGDDRAVILIGYEDKMKEMFRKVNPGLSRRFPIEHAFVFSDYGDKELSLILDKKLSEQDLLASDEAKRTAIKMLAKLRRRPNFGNAGEVDNLLSQAKQACIHRRSRLAVKNDEEFTLEAHDFEPDFKTSVDAIEKCQSLFKDVVDSKEIVRKLTGYIRSYRNALQNDMNPAEMLPFNFVFKGPPGTGKTTTAMKMGTVFADMGFLSSDKVVECSATDLIGQYIGQTGPKVLAKFDEALGQVLFIDEAYRLGDGGAFVKEAVDEIVDCLTKERYKGKMLVILAGYEEEINSLLGVNPGLSSRFPEEIMFRALTPRMCIDLLIKQLQGIEKLHLDLETDLPHQDIGENLLAQLSVLPGWGNGRDINTLKGRIVSNVLSNHEPGRSNMTVAWPDIVSQIRRLYDERRQRDSKRSNKAPEIWPPQLRAQTNDRQNLPSSFTPIASTSTMLSKPAQVEELVDEPVGEQIGETEMSGIEEQGGRDAGVSDAVWQQLLIDKAIQEEREAKSKKDIHEAQARHKLLEQEALEAQKIVDAEIAEQLARLAQPTSRNDQADQAKETNIVDDEERRRHEANRLQALAKKRKADEEHTRLRELLAQQRQEQTIQSKLRDMGICPAGFRWIKQAHGYRCGGGSHFISDGQLGI